MQPIDTINPTIHLAVRAAILVSRSSCRMPTPKPHLHRIDGGDTAALLALISSLRARVARRLDAAIGVVCCFEAGRDGFWLHRLLTAHGVAKNLTMMPLPPVCPELNAAENIWQYMRQTYLSNRVFAGYTAIVDACQNAWRRLLNEPGRIASIATRDWATIGQPL